MDARAELLWEALDEPTRSELAARFVQSLRSYVEGDHASGLSGMAAVLEPFGLYLCEAEELLSSHLNANPPADRMRQ
jgi:hypothetical protein